MLKKLFKDKKKRYRNLILVILPFVILIGVFSFVAYSSASSLATGGSTGFSNSIDTMDYHLRNNATDIQEEYFRELSELCSADAETKDKAEIARSVVKNFIADFYTWTNKAGSYDVGGLYYVHSPSKVSIMTNARDGFYKYVTNYIEEYGSENLLEVASVDEITGGESVGEYEYNGVTYDAYYFHATWTYVDHDGFDESKYATSENFLVIENEDGRFEIVQAYGDQI